MKWQDVLNSLRGPYAKHVVGIFVGFKHAVHLRLMESVLTRFLPRIMPLVELFSGKKGICCEMQYIGLIDP